MSTDIEFNKTQSLEKEEKDVFIEGNTDTSKKVLSIKKSPTAKYSGKTRINLNDLNPSLADKLRHLDLTND